MVTENIGLTKKLRNYTHDCVDNGLPAAAMILTAPETFRTVYQAATSSLPNEPVSILLKLGAAALTIGSGIYLGRKVLDYVDPLP